MKFYRITTHPENGETCICGSYISVRAIIDLVAKGLNETHILELFPELEKEDIREAVEYTVLTSIHTYS